MTLDALQSSDLRPFDALIRAGIPAVMMNHLRYSSIDPDLPASLSPRAYQLLRGLGFQGAAITDSVGMAAVNRTWDVAEASVRAVAAGADGVLNTGGQTAKDMRHGLVAAVLRRQARRVPDQRGGVPDGGPRRRRPGDGDVPDGRLAARRGTSPRRPSGAGTQPVPTQPQREQTQLGPVAAYPAKQGQG